MSSRICRAVFRSWTYSRESEGCGSVLSRQAENACSPASGTGSPSRRTGQISLKKRLLAIYVRLPRLMCRRTTFCWQDSRASPFSLAGVSKKRSLNEPHGFACEAQGTLFFDLARLIGHHRPKAFLLENVKHLLGHDGGQTFEVIRSILADKLGYHISYRVIDAKAWVPQHRERIFIVGFRDDTDFDLRQMLLPDDSGGPELGDILHSEDGSEEPEPHYTEGELGTVSERYTLSEHLWDYLQAYAAKHQGKGNGFGYGLVGRSDIARTLSARYYKDGSEILVMQEGKRPRRLTPRECSRLMGFDGLTESHFVIPVSDTQAYRQFGNAVAVPCVQAIAEYMVDWLD